MCIRDSSCVHHLRGRFTGNFTTTISMPMYEDDLPVCHYTCTRGARTDIIDLRLVKGVVSPIKVTVFVNLSFDHCPLQVHVATVHAIGRSQRVVERNWYGFAFYRRLSKPVLLDGSSVAMFDDTEASLVKLCSRVNPNLTPATARSWRMSIFSLKKRTDSRDNKYKYLYFQYTY